MKEAKQSTPSFPGAVFDDTPFDGMSGHPVEVKLEKQLRD